MYTEAEPFYNSAFIKCAVRMCGCVLHCACAVHTTSSNNNNKTTSCRMLCSFVHNKRRKFFFRCRIHCKYICIIIYWPLPPAATTIIAPYCIARPPPLAIIIFWQSVCAHFICAYFCLPFVGVVFVKIASK